MNQILLPTVHSLHWDNISDSILSAQKAVFDKLGIPVIQHLVDQKDHGEWMTEVVLEASDDEVIVFCDIDAFPLNRAAYEDAVASARAGEIFGLAQFSAHVVNKNLYAGPMFLTFQRKTWVALGSPDLRGSAQSDAAAILSIKARENGVPLRLIRPMCCIKSKWPLGSEGVFGIGTFYGSLDFFHLFESRYGSSVKLMKLVSMDVANGNALNFSSYLDAVHANSFRAQLLEVVKYRIKSIWCNLIKIK